MKAADSTVKEAKKAAVVPGFLTKTFDIFSDDSYIDYCGWTEDGNGIVIKKVIIWWLVGMISKSNVVANCAIVSIIRGCIDVRVQYCSFTKVFQALKLPVFCSTA